MATRVEKHHITTPVTCAFCGKVFENGTLGLIPHLQHCRKRSWPREFDFPPYRITVHLNPTAPRVRALKQAKAEQPDNIQYFLGAVTILKRLKIIHEFDIEKIDDIKAREAAKAQEESAKGRPIAMELA